MSGTGDIVRTSGRRHFRLFDGLRAIAVTMVLLSHILGSAGLYRGRGRALFSGMGQGVVVFFVVSGFLMYRPFVIARYEGKRFPDVGVYASRRFLRIVPAYWVALTLLAVWPGLSGVFTKHFWVFYGFGQIYDHSQYQGLFVAWSLCVEMAFYALLPIYAAIVARLARRADDLVPDVTLMAAFVAYSIFTKWWLVHSHLHPITGLTNGLFMRLDWFVPGMALAVASVRLQGREGASAVARFVTRRATLCWIAAAGLYIVTTQMPARALDTSAVELITHSLLTGIVATLIVLPAVFGESVAALPRRVLGQRVILWIGTISYGIFLWHYPLAFQVARITRNPIVGVILLMTLSCALGAMSWYGIERTAINWGRRREPRSSEALTVPPVAIQEQPARP